MKAVAVKKSHASSQTCFGSRTVASQTLAHPDIPYKVTEALPPIFSMKLKRKTPKISFLPNSTPDLTKVCWCGPDIHDLTYISDDDIYDESQWEVLYTDTGGEPLMLCGDQATC